MVGPASGVGDGTHMELERDQRSIEDAVKRGCKCCLGGTWGLGGPLWNGQPEGGPCPSLGSPESRA